MIPENNIEVMSKQLIFNILNAFGLPEKEIWYQAIKPFFSSATEELSRIALYFDRLISESDISKAAEWSIFNWCRGILARGHETVPPKGPLLVVSNHPGAYDALIITAHLQRPDLHIMASDIPFLRSLQKLRERIFFIPMNKKDAVNRMAGMLAAIRHLKSGGAVLLMGSGSIEPDPAVLPGALDHINNWTRAVEIFIRSVPDAKIVLSAISHILTTKWAYHPITWIRRGGLEKRRIAEFGQVLQQLFSPGSLYVSPRLSFAKALNCSELGSSPREILLENESSLLVEHCQIYGGSPY